VAVSEGIHRAGEEPLAAVLDKDAPVDPFGHKLLIGSALADHLVRLVTDALPDGTRIRSDTFGYLQRCFPGVVSPTDAAEAREVGRTAVRLAFQGVPEGSVVIVREPGRPYRARYDVTDLANVARVTKSLDRIFVNQAGNNVLDSFRDYVAPLAGDLPTVEYLA
jgi:6-phosphofructokinase 1